MQFVKIYLCDDKKKENAFTYVLLILRGVL